ncbi:MAG: transposase [Conexibacter sp.]|nr:transposase [Conexibacter sp.]
MSSQRCSAASVTAPNWVDARRVLQQRLHDQLNALCPALSAPRGHGRALKLSSPTGQAVLACAAAFEGRPPSKRSLLARAPGRLTEPTAAFWVARWKRLLDPPADAQLRAAGLGRDLARWHELQTDIALADGQLADLLAQTDGQILTSLPGVAIVRAAAFNTYTLPIERWRTPEHLYSATGLATATYQSSTITRRGRISRQGLPEHRNALMGIAWGLSLNSDAFKARNAEYRARGFRPIQARVALARHACRLCWRLLTPNSPTTISVTLTLGGAGGDGAFSYAARPRHLACRPPAQPPPTAHTKACRTTAPDQPADHAAAARAPPLTDLRKLRDLRSRR